MNRTFGAVLFGLVAAAIATAGAQASVPFSVIDQATGAPTLAPVLKKIAPSVVGIAIKAHPGTEAVASAGQKKPREAKRTEPSADHQVRASGSGVVIDARQGLIITNNHVIEHADEITVTLDDGRELQAKLVGGDPDTDIAVIKIAADNLIAMPVGNSDVVEVGDFVLAIGNPFMIGQTVTSGIVSGLHRNNVGIEQYENFIQTDAAIYPGNSGGALVNLRGELVGINTAFIGASNTNPGMGFAIPINMARAVVDHLLESGDVRRGRLGITFEDPTPALAREFKIVATQPAPVITKVDPGSSAERAGVKAGDVVTELGGTPVHDTADLRSRLGLLWIGDTAELTLTRDGKPTVIRAAITDKEQRAETHPKQK